MARGGDTLGRGVGVLVPTRNTPTNMTTSPSQIRPMSSGVDAGSFGSQ